MAPQKQYLDDNGNAIPPPAGAATGPQYLDDNGNPTHTAAKTTTRVPSLLERMKANFNAGTQHPAPPQTLMQEFSPHRIVEEIGARTGDAIRELPHMFQKRPKKNLNDILAQGQQQTEQFLNDPVGAYADAYADAGVGLMEGEMVGMPLRGVGKFIKTKGLEHISGTTPRDVVADVKRTSAENVAATKAADEANAKAAERRQVDLKKHFDKTQAARQEPTPGLIGTKERTPQEVQSHKEALNRGMERLDPQFQEDLGSLKKRVNAENNAKFEKLAAHLNDIEATPEFLPDAVVEAAEKFKGSNTEPTIFRDMEKRVERGEPVPYKDLQGYYSELGKELSKGTLAGDVYTAYSTLHDAVGNEMQRIADANGLGPQLREARTSWRQMKETFYDPKSPVTKALKAPEPGHPVKGAAAKFQGMDKSGVEALARYDPALARRANTLRGYQAEAKGIPKAPAPKALPRLAPKEPPVVAETKNQTIGSLESLKGQRRMARAEALHNAKSPIVNAFAAYGSIKAALLFNLPTLGLDVTARILYGAAKPLMGDILESPGVARELDKFSARDAEGIMRLPPDQRAAFVGDLKPIVEAAKQRGLPVSPALAGLVFEQHNKPQQKKGVAAALQPVGAP